MESKNDKFKRLANKRVPAALEKLDKIVKALTQSVSEIKKSFDEKTKPKFKI